MDKVEDGFMHAVEAAAEAAAAPEHPAKQLRQVEIPDPTRQEIKYGAPPFGQAPEGGINIVGGRSPNGVPYVRITFASAAGLTLIDLPCQNDQGQNVAEMVGAALIENARQARTGLVIAK